MIALFVCRRFFSLFFVSLNLDLDPLFFSPLKKLTPRQDQTAPYQQPRQQQQTSIGVVSASAAAATPNSITLLGKLNAPFEIRTVPGRAGFGGGGNNSSPSSCVATSQLAFSVGRDKTEWVAVEAWGPLAEAAAASGLGRGDRVRAIGRLRCNEYSDRATGQKRRSIKVTLESLARVHDGPVADAFGASSGASEWADQSQLLPPATATSAGGEWAPPSGAFAAAGSLAALLAFLGAMAPDVLLAAAAGGWGAARARARQPASSRAAKRALRRAIVAIYRVLRN